MTRDQLEALMELMRAYADRAQMAARGNTQSHSVVEQAEEWVYTLFGFDNN